jgi:Heparinase II/III-like protein/Heparinase II/III N-terminus
MSVQSKLKACSKLRPIFCVIEQAYQNVALAEEVCAGRFTHVGISLELGAEPDWLSDDLPADEEWRIEWSKFYYGLDLAQAFLQTSDYKYLRSWERLVRSWIRQVPVNHDTTDVTGRRIQNWIYAWNLFQSSPEFAGLAEDLQGQIITSIEGQANYLRLNLTAERNHRTLELYALFVAALALPDIDVDGSLLDFAIHELHRNLMTDVRPDGVHRESSTHYHMTVLRSFLGARENARRFGLAVPDGYDGRLERACEFAMYCHRPDGLIPALSDSDTGSYLDILKLAASIFSRPDFLYVATAGRQGIAPRERYASFPDAGYFIERSGWGEGETSFRDERYLIFDCGPLGDGGHGHYDLLNVEIAAQGRPLIVDPGRYTYCEQPPNWRRWFKGTAAHNTVCVDGVDQTPYRRGKPKGRISQGRFRERLSAPDFDLMRGEATSPAYEVTHTRRIFFVAGEYWIIADHLRGERAHRFDLRFHLSPEAQDRITIEAGENVLVARTPECGLTFYRASKLKVEPGWYAPFYGVKHPAPVVSVSVDGVAEANFYTLVTPLKSNQRLPAFQVHADEDQVTTFEVSRVGPDGAAADVVRVSESDEGFALGHFDCRATVAWLRRSDERESLRACDVRELAGSYAGAGFVLKSANPLRWVMCDERSGIAFDDGRKL